MSTPKIWSLPHSWFAFKFGNTKETCKALASHWNIEHAPIFFKQWSHLFNPEREQLGVGPIWLCLPGLSMHLWTQDICWHIGDDLGKFLDYDCSCLESGIRTCARVLVFLDTREGLLENLILHYKGFTHNQILDYDGVHSAAGNVMKWVISTKTAPWSSKKRKPNWVEEQSTLLTLFIFLRMDW